MHAGVLEMFRRHFSITVQRNHMRFGGIVAPNSGCLSLTLGLCSSFSFNSSLEFFVALSSEGGKKCDQTFPPPPPPLLK